MSETMIAFMGMMSFVVFIFSGIVFVIGDEPMAAIPLFFGIITFLYCVDQTEKVDIHKDPKPIQSQYVDPK